jgi:hypothetical protein
MPNYVLINGIRIVYTQLSHTQSPILFMTYPILCPTLGLSENRVPLNPVVYHHFLKKNSHIFLGAHPFQRNAYGSCLKWGLPPNHPSF